MKAWRLGWTSTEYVSGQWQSVTEIREFEDDSDLSDLVCVVTTDRAKRIMDAQAALAQVAAERDAALREVERLVTALDKAAGRLGHLATALSLSNKPLAAKDALEWGEQARAALEERRK